MKRERKRWTAVEKMTVLNFYNQNGIVRTVREFGLSSNQVYKWRDAYEQFGAEGLKGRGGKSVDEKDLALKRLLKENQELKTIIAEKELHIRIQQEMLKKTL